MGTPANEYALMALVTSFVVSCTAAKAPSSTFLKLALCSITGFGGGFATGAPQSFALQAFRRVTKLVRISDGWMMTGDHMTVTVPTTKRMTAMTIIPASFDGGQSLIADLSGHFSQNSPCTV